MYNCNMSLDIQKICKTEWKFTFLLFVDNLRKQTACFMDERHIVYCRTPFSSFTRKKHALAPKWPELGVGCTAVNKKE